MNIIELTNNIRLAVMFLAFIPSFACAYNGEEITALTIDGIEMSFVIISETEKTCRAGTLDPDNRSCISISTEGIVTIPEKVGKYTVTEIGTSAFKDCDISRIIIPESVTSIGSKAFYFCHDLISVNIPSKVNNIFPSAFNGCVKLQSITIPDNVTHIYWETFRNCESLSKIDLPKSVTEIGRLAFDGCSSLKEVTNSSNIRTIAFGAFRDCKSLTSISFPQVRRIEDFTFSGCTGLTNITIASSLSSIGKNVFFGCSGLESINVDAQNKYYDSRDNCNAIIKTSTNELIAGCKNSNIKSSVVSISSYAFSGCTGLKTLNIPNTITNIGLKAFSGCSNLTNISIPSSVSCIMDSTFFDCSSLQSIEIPNEVTTIGRSAFEKCSSLSTIKLPEGLSEISHSTFRDCSALKEIFIPNSVKSIKYSAFLNCVGLTKVVMSDDLERIDWDAFSGCIALTEIILPDALNSIGSNAFSGCIALTGIILPDALNSIGSNAFSGCISLKRVYIPKSVKTIFGNLFDECTNLSQIVVEDGNSVYDSRENCNAIIKTASNELVIGCKSTIIPNSVTSIGYGAFSNCTSLTNLIIPNSVTSIGYNAFSGCTSLTNLIIPNSVTSIGDYAFSSCTSLTSLIIPDSVKSIGYDAFSRCTSLVRISIPSSVTSIKGSTFYGCISLMEIKIPKSVTSIGSFAFYNCKGLKTITIPYKVDSIGDYAFSGCTDLNNVISNIRVPFEISDQVFERDSYIETYPTLYVPYGTDLLYKSTQGWNNMTIIGKENMSSEGDTFIVATKEGIQVTYSIMDVEEKLCEVGNGEKSSIVDLAAKHISIPDTANGYGVIAFNNYALTNCKSLLSISFPSTITTLGNKIFKDCSSLAAIQWNAESELPAAAMDGIENPNLLLYVKDGKFAPNGNWNIVKNGVADDIVLHEAASGNNFYCPKEFTARSITYSHNYSMISGYKTCQGWETIALPFDVANISYGESVELVPIKTWKAGSQQRPFWLYEYTSEGWQAVTAIKANTPYIICMPNNPEKYEDSYNIEGEVIYKAANTKVLASDNVTTAKYGERHLSPNFEYQPANNSIYALNVSNQWEKYGSLTYAIGSTFVPGLRPVHPFEAYMVYEGTNAPLHIPVFDGEGVMTGIPTLTNEKMQKNEAVVFDLTGRKISSSTDGNLQKGVYIVNGRKVVVK